MANLKSDVQYFDSTIDGTVRNGHLQERYEGDALRTALLLWIGSFNGDFIGGEPRGGYAFSALSAPLNEDGASEVQERILYGLRHDFPITVNVNSIIISINEQKRMWNIELDVTAPNLGLRATIDESIRAID
jgi:hypothetical protein